MTDLFSIGQFTVDKEERKKSPRFAFLKISATTHLAHLRSLQNHYATYWQPQKSQILPILRKITGYDQYICTLIEA